MREPFTPRFFQRLQQLRIRTRRAFLGTRQGVHLSNRRGHGLEFADYRVYTAGDDFRHIDWGVFARTDRLYVRQFRDEQDLNVIFLLDTSASMAGAGDKEKFSLARDLAISLGYIALATGDTVTFSLLGAKNSPKYRGPRALPKIFRELDAIQPTGTYRLLDEVRAAASRHKIPGKCFLISDLLLPPEDIFDTLDHLRARNFETVVFQVLSNTELSLDLPTGTHTAVDDETGDEIELALGAASKREYASLLSSHVAVIEEYCHRAVMPHVLLSSADSLADVVLNRLPQLGLLK